MLMVERHSEMLHNLRKSSEQTRLKLTGRAEYNLQGHYSVRLRGSNKWYRCEEPPCHGAEEWIFVTLSGTPLFYWSAGRNGVMLIS